MPDGSKRKRRNGTGGHVRQLYYATYRNMRLAQRFWKDKHTLILRRFDNRLIVVYT